MDAKNIIAKSLFIVSFIISVLFSLFCAFSLIFFIFDPSDKEKIQLLIISLLLCTICWAISFGIVIFTGKKTKQEKIEGLKDIMVKMPLILLSSGITSLYVIVYMFFFSFVTVSGYGDGGLGAGVSKLTLFTVFVLLGIVIFGLVMYQVFKTKTSDITLTLYNQFSILKWSSLIALPFGLWSAYYFYHTEKRAYIFILFYGLIFWGAYKLFDKLTNKVQSQITTANVNRIIHEKKKRILDAEKKIQNQKVDVETMSDSLLKLKKLLDQGVITREEFEFQKKKFFS